MSQEPRTPLDAIGGYTEPMPLGLRGPLTEAQERDLERIRVSQQHLLGLVSAVLDMNRIERGQTRLHRRPAPHRAPPQDSVPTRAGRRAARPRSAG